MPNPSSFERSFVLAFSAVVAALCVTHATRAAEPTAPQILEATGVKGGLIVHVGCGDGALTAALRISDKYLVHGLDKNAANVAKARAHVQSLGMYGPVCVDRLSSERLPYTDGLVNLIISDGSTAISDAEIARVLVPRGVAYIKQGDTWKKTVKPVPAEIDEWTHYLHSAGGNAVADDTVVGPPRHLQWLGSPRWSRHHDRMASMSALVSAGGRMFYIMDEGSRISIQTPPKWSLIARDAHNGVILWKHPIYKWFSHLWPLKSGPTQLARRLVAVDDRVYVAMGLNAPLSALDAATGETVHVFEGSETAEEVIVSGDTVYVLVNKGKWALEDYAPKLNVGDQGRVAREYQWNQKPRLVSAYNAKAGKALWSVQSKVAPLTMAADARGVYFHDGERVFGLDAATGKQRFRTDPAGRRSNVTFNFGSKLVLYGDTLLFAGGDRKMHAFDTATGKHLWESAHERGGYQSPEDLLVVGGLIWSAPLTSGRDSGNFTGRDPRTGEVKVEFPPTVETYWFHHRCHIAKATTNFLIPSRTGIEFIDYKNKDWSINHFVRGGCLYGVLPCNGLVYAPPHNCACYPEAKLFGFNALAPATPTRLTSEDLPAKQRIERGRGDGDIGRPEGQSTGGDWPTYRGDRQRSGYASTAVSKDLKPAWKTTLGGKLSPVTVADGKLFVAQVDAHTVHALDAKTGQKLWSYTTGGRVDSPPTCKYGAVVFGSADGHVYCLSAKDGQLIWRFRAAPRDLRLTSFEQLESVWPVHGSVLVEDEYVYFVAGRSMFLDGGIHYYQLALDSGQVIRHRVLDEKDPSAAPGSGKTLQDRIQILQMPVGLPDVLSSDGTHLYMRSQVFDKTGKRLDLGPNSGDFRGQASVQRGPTAHIFSPTGFLDDSYFHRSYWVYGRSFAGGHGGYFQAGKYAPGGRLLVHDDKSVFGFGRKPQYYRWTTIIEHQLFSAPREQPPVVAAPSGGGAAASRGTMVRVANTPALDPTGKPVTVEAWAKATKPTGVVLARGASLNGYALLINKGQPQFVIRSAEKAYTVTAREKVVGKWTHLVGVLTPDKQLQLYVDGELAAKSGGALIASEPKQPMEIGADDGGAQGVGAYAGPMHFAGAIDEVRVYHRALSAADVKQRYADPAALAGDKALVLAYSFDKGKGADASGGKHHGTVQAAKVTTGKHGDALAFSGTARKGGAKNAGRNAGSQVVHDWTRDVPLFVQAMVKAGPTLFIAGPPDTVDEEESFERLANRDKKIEAALAEQNASFNGANGALLRVVNAADGETLAEYKLDALPTWDGLAAAQGRLYLTDKSGQVVCFETKK